MMVGYAEKHSVNNRIGADMMALDRVAFTIRKRGLHA
jgi:glutamate dehydrogenase (NAD(P)+)